MNDPYDELLTRVVRECGSWSSAERRIRFEYGANFVAAASRIALRERGPEWLRGERQPVGSVDGRKH